MNKQEAPSLAVVVPAAGVGKRMKSACPKQYLTIKEQTVLEHTVLRLLSHPAIEQVVIALGNNDEYYQDTSLINHPQIKTVVGGQERVDSVLAGLKYLQSQGLEWALVHDAARPCITVKDIDTLVQQCISTSKGGLLAYPAKDTIKRTANQQDVDVTVDRSVLWHALTPQMFKTNELVDSIEYGLAKGLTITDESSAIEQANLASQLVEGSSDNIKITRPEDLALAEFILTNQEKSQQEKLCE